HRHPRLGAQGRGRLPRRCRGRVHADARGLFPAPQLPDPRLQRGPARLPAARLRVRDSQRRLEALSMADEPVSRDQAEAAVRTLLRWAGEDPAREGLLDTPKRVVQAYRDWFSGYAEDPAEYLARTFEEVAGYDELIVLRDIEFESHCEHHMAPIVGKAHIGYLPDGKVVGISKLARVVDAYARRFQVQEKMTAQI